MAERARGGSGIKRFGRKWQKEVWEEVGERFGRKWHIGIGRERFGRKWQGEVGEEVVYRMAKKSWQSEVSEPEGK